MYSEFSAEQFKEMSYSTLKDKFIPFSLGLSVTIIALFSVVSQIPSAKVYAFVHDVEEKIIASTRIQNLIQPPEITHIDIQKILATNKMNGGGNVQTEITPTLTPTLNPTQTPSPTQVVEQGDISAISSKRVTFKGDTYTVQQGEGLYEIAEKVYGDGMMWTAIAEANKLSSPDLIEVGMKLKIPKKK